MVAGRRVRCAGPVGRLLWNRRLAVGDARSARSSRGFVRRDRLGFTCFATLELRRVRAPAAIFGYDEHGRVVSQDGDLSWRAGRRPREERELPML